MKIHAPPESGNALNAVAHQIGIAPESPPPRAKPKKAREATGKTHGLNLSLRHWCRAKPGAWSGPGQSVLGRAQNGGERGSRAT